MRYRRVDNPIRVQVERTVLLDAIKKERAKAIEKHRVALARWEADQEKLAQRVAKALTAAAKDARSGKLPEVKKGYGRESAYAVVNIPGKVTDKPEIYLDGFDSAITMLKLSKQETITVSENGPYAGYLG